MTTEINNKNTLHILIDPDDASPSATVKHVMDVAVKQGIEFEQVVATCGYLRIGRACSSGVFDRYGSPVVAICNSAAWVLKGQAVSVSSATEIELVRYPSGDTDSVKVNRKVIIIQLDSDDPNPSDTIKFMIEEYSKKNNGFLEGNQFHFGVSPSKPVNDSTPVTAKISTMRGDIEIELFADVAPMTVANFVNLSQRGFYDGLNFHRVIADFMIQGGCPDGSGRGGPGYRFNDETKNGMRHHRGVLSMANAGPNTNGSQFFITHIKTDWLDGKHTVFGKVTSGMEVVDSIKQGDVIEKITIAGPYAAVLENQAHSIRQWNRAMDETTCK